MSPGNKTLRVILEEKEAKLRKELKRLRKSAAKKLLSDRLEEILEAKERLENETYGFCEQCYISIPWRELCSQPEKRVCSTCKYNYDKDEIQQVG